MNLLAVLGIVLAAVAVSVGAMYLVRRIAKPDHFLEDMTRGAAIFGVVGTAFAVLLAFVMFVAFQSYTNAKDSAVAEAAALDSMFGSSRYFPGADRDLLEASLICYARSVVHVEWDAMKDGEDSTVTDDWRHVTEQELRDLDPDTPVRVAGNNQLLAEHDTLSAARHDRLIEADPVVSAPVWLILGLGGLATVSFVLIFTDRREAFPVQASLIAAVAAMVSASLTLVWFLDHPYQGDNGSIEPVRMQRELDELERERPEFAVPCDEQGLRLR
jgi:hypothetical protein